MVIEDDCEISDLIRTTDGDMPLHTSRSRFGSGITNAGFYVPTLWVVPYEQIVKQEGENV